MGFELRWITRLALAAGALAAAEGAAGAYEVHRTTGGAPVRWTQTRVELEISEDLDDAVKGGARIAAQSVSAWSESPGPALAKRTIEDTPAPGYDGRNVIVYAKKGFAPAGGALAVTVLTYDNVSGQILDADIVINGKHSFIECDPSSRPNPGDSPLSAHAAAPATKAFDLGHVVAHEVGHVLGLADTTADGSALMYAYVWAKDASRRAPAVDDRAGLKLLYEASGEGGSSGGASAGCAVVPSSGRGAAGDALAPWMALGCAVAFLVGARRRHVVLGVSLALVLGGPTAFASSEGPRDVAPAALRVLSTETVVEGGLLRTRAVLRPLDCSGACDERVVESWGGTLGSITQRVAGHHVPRPGDVVRPAPVAP